MDTGSLKNIIDALDPKETICFFSGTFNPWHQGHVSCIKLHTEYAPTIPLIILPDRNPIKNFSTPDIGEIQKSLKTLSLDSKIIFSELFLKQQNSNPTHSWICPLKNNFPKLKLGLLLGFDTFLDLPKWIEAAKLLMALDFLEVVPRNSHEQEGLAKELATTLKLKYPHLQIHFLPHHDFEDLSSTQIRQK